MDSTNTQLPVIKRGFPVILVILIIAAGVFIYFKPNPPIIQPSLLTVAGQGKIKSIPEIAQFTITYAVTGKTISDTTNAEKEQQQKIITLLNGIYGVDLSNIKVSYPKIVSNSLGGVTFYQTANTLNVEFKKLQNLDEAISKLYDTGKDVAIGNIVFSTTNARDLEDKVLTLAVDDAKIRAQNMAKAAERKLGKLISITGEQMQSIGTVTYDANKDISKNATTPGQIELVRNVTIVYELK